MCSSSRKAAGPLLRLVDAGALEHRRAVVEDVRERVDLRVGEIHEPPVHPDFLDVLVGHAASASVDVAARSISPCRRECQCAKSQTRQRRAAPAPAPATAAVSARSFPGGERRRRPIPAASAASSSAVGPASLGADEERRRARPAAPAGNGSPPGSRSSRVARVSSRERLARARPGPRSRASARAPPAWPPPARRALEPRRRARPLARKRCVRSLATSVSARGAELGRLLGDPGQPLGRAPRRRAGGSSRIRASAPRRAPPRRRRPGTRGRSPRDAVRGPRGRCRRRAPPRSPAREPAGARVGAPPRRRRGRLAPAAGSASTIRRAPDTGRSIRPRVRRPASFQRPRAHLREDRRLALPRRLPTAGRGRAGAAPREQARAPRAGSPPASMLATTRSNSPRAGRERPRVEPHAVAEGVPRAGSRARRRPPPRRCRDRRPRRAPSAAAARARMPEPGPDVEHACGPPAPPPRGRAARAASTRGCPCRRPATPARAARSGPRGAAAPGGSPGSIQRRRPDGERPRRRAVGLERVALGDVGRQRVAGSLRPRSASARGARRSRRRGRTRRGPGPSSSNPRGPWSDSSPSTASSPDFGGTSEAAVALTRRGRGLTRKIFFAFPKHCPCPCRPARRSARRTCAAAPSRPSTEIGHAHVDARRRGRRARSGRGGPCPCPSGAARRPTGVPADDRDLPRGRRASARTTSPPSTSVGNGRSRLTTMSSPSRAKTSSSATVSTT